VSLTVKRISLVACIALGGLALGAGSASAAGKPTSVALTNTHEVNGYTVLELTAKVNPNGASTSARIEYREAGTEKWTEAPAHVLSGTTVRSYSEELYVKPVQNYEARVKATNLYGTTLSSTATVSTRVRTTSEKDLTNASYGSEGVASFVWTYVSNQFNAVCNENSWGNIGNAGGKGDIYHYSMFGCILFMNGKEQQQCKISNFTFILSGPTLHPEGNVIPILGGCAPQEYWGIAPDPFRVVDNGSAAEYGKVRSVSLTATGTYGTSNPAEITIESSWYLSGPFTETPFKIADVGL
jgi:hypothetical protein